MALSFEEPDRVPTDCWMSQGFKRKLEAATGMSEEAFLDSNDVDLRYIEGPRYVGPPLLRFPDGSDEDIWGVRRQTVVVPTPGGAETYKEVAASPLAQASTVEEVNAYDRWPSADWFDYSRIAEQCETIRNRGRVVVFMGDRLNRIGQLKPAMYLRGIEEIFADMLQCPEIAHAVIANIRRFYCSYAERILEASKGMLDIVLTGDDFGSQGAPLVSPAMWVDFLGRGFSDYVSIARSYGVRVVHHTCGSVRSLIPLLIERGLDVLQSLQPEAANMEPRRLKAEFGDRLAVHGGISIQRVLPFGTPQEVRNEVRDRVEALAPGGGYILCTSHNIQADVPVENAMELFKAYQDYGRYA